MIGGLEEEIRSVREVIEMPLAKPEIFQRVGIKPPKGVLLYGPPGTGKTLIAKAIASQIGQSARVIREMFTYAKQNEPCIIFIDEIDAIGSKRQPHGNSADREIQRTMLELLHQMDGFNPLQINLLLSSASKCGHAGFQMVAADWRQESGTTVLV